MSRGRHRRDGRGQRPALHQPDALGTAVGDGQQRLCLQPDEESVQQGQEPDSLAHQHHLRPGHAQQRGRRRDAAANQRGAGLHECCRGERLLPEDADRGSDAGQADEGDDFEHHLHEQGLPAEACLQADGQRLLRRTARNARLPRRQDHERYQPVGQRPHGADDHEGARHAVLQPRCCQLSAERHLLQGGMGGEVRQGPDAQRGVQRRQPGAHDAPGGQPAVCRDSRLPSPADALRQQGLQHDRPAATRGKDRRRRAGGTDGQDAGATAAAGGRG